MLDESDYRPLLNVLLSRVMETGADVLVAEAGASPMEPYNGSACIEALGDHIKFRVLCASDPYAMVGVQKAYGLVPDLVSGPAASTLAAIKLVKNLTGVPAVNVLHRDSFPVLSSMLRAALGLN